ncbi:MAG: hypothetical protein ACC656_11100 [Candidatus Heimdallarchaeota archaeon]
MTISSQSYFVSKYLTNFFAEASEDEIQSVIAEINPAIIEVMSTLIDHDMSIKEIVETTSNRIKNLETVLQSKDREIKILEEELTDKSKSIYTSEPKSERSIDLTRLEKLKILRSATYNARLYLICQEICRRYGITTEPISLRRVHRELGQSRIIHAFNPSTRSPKESYLTQLINDLYTIKRIGKELTAVPTRLGLEIYDLGLDYYSKEKTEARFNSMRQNGELSATKLKLFDTICSSSLPVNNLARDKINLAQRCGIHKDNISKYLVDLVKLGFLERIPVESTNNRFKYRCYNYK